MTDCLAVLAHELRNPVAALQAIAETVGQRPLAPDLERRLLALALAAGHDVERLAVDAFPTSLIRQEIDPRQLVLDLTEAAALRGQPVRAELEPSLPPLVGDPVRLRQALANLLENAVAHAPPGTDVVVAARLLGGRVELSVTDRGEGVASELQQAIFELGRRFADRPGQGIGLALARAIAEAHDGTLTVASAPGAGATFTLALPSSGGGRG